MLTEEKPVPSATYAVMVPDNISDHKGYFTIVGEFEPESFFLNSKEMGSYQWVTALMTSFSRQMAAGVPIENIISDMKGTFDPNGSYFIPGSGIEVNSIIHHLGIILENHMEYMIAKQDEMDDAST